MTNFQPTALLVMTHNVTRLRYFCKTTRLNQIKYYKGSGIYWKRHLKTYGKNVTVGVLGIYFDKQRCLDAAKKFSVDNDIVASDEWANLIEENGYDGAPAGNLHPNYGKPSPCIGQKRPQTSEKLKGTLNPMYGKIGFNRGIEKPKGKDSPLYGRKRPDGSGKLPRAVICIDTKEEFSSVSEAAKSVNCGVSMISRCCLGKSKSAMGKRWIYKESI